MSQFCPTPFFEGYITAICLIIAIGPQNLFLLRQSIQKNYAYTTAMTLALTDAVLILLGVNGVGEIFSSNEMLLFLAKWGGALFLFYYGYRSMRSAFATHQVKLGEQNPSKPSLKESLLFVFALSFLNPHAYLDTVVLLGSISCNFPDLERPFFALGGILASLSWFCFLAFSGSLLRPFFEKPIAWKILDCITTILLWAIAFAILLHKH
ncbi:MAG: LysE family transporter [Chlamydiales bacterium]|nr:LysE family transporter [Chlamydiales bacterium]